MHINAIFSVPHFYVISFIKNFLNCIMNDFFMSALLSLLWYMFSFSFLPVNYKTSLVDNWHLQIKLSITANLFLFLL